MAQPFVPGPAPIFVSDSSSAIPFFLGYSERGVSFSHDPSYVPYYCDLGGATPLDFSYQGESMMIHLDLVRWNPAVLRTIQDVIDHDGAFGNPGSAPGVDVAGEIGTLMAYQNAGQMLWVAFPYANSQAFAGNPPGYRFPCAILEREGLPEHGSKPAKVSMSFRAVRNLDMRPATLTPFGAGKLTLYDFDMSAINGIFPD